MELPKEQIQEIKKQLIEQIQTTFPEDKKQEALQQIESLNDEQLIEFLKQNNLIKTPKNSSDKCIFCSIVFGDIPSTKIAENEKAIAILEINPISEGHTIIVPKEHLEKEQDLNEQIKQLAKEISQKIAVTFNPKKIDIIPGNVTGHEILNVIPVYNNENLASPRIKKTPEQLAELKNKIEQTKVEKNKEEKPKPVRKKQIITKEDMILPKRIP